MLNRFTFLLIAALCCAHAHAQQRTLLNFELRAFLKTAPPEMPVDLYLQGNTTLVERIAKAHGAFIKMKMRNWTSVRMPAGRIHELDAEEELISIDFRLSRAQTMNDSMRLKTHIDQVQLGLAPLPQGYDGDGVVVGIVDTGLDFHHPDFSDSLTGTRVLHYWGHNFPLAANTPPGFGYGQEWNKAVIDAGNCPAGDGDSGGHGTTVAGTAAGNAQATGHCLGAAPKSDIVIVQSYLNAPNWIATVADGIKYVFDKATLLGEPAVVNLSLGEYLGSHDGLDPTALFIDSMLMAAPGRVVVAAAGNSACFPNYTLRMDVDSDTSFAWIRSNSANFFLGGTGAYIDFWGDTASMNNIQYSIGADRVTGGYAYRGRIPFRNVQGTINTDVVDTLFSTIGQQLAVCTTFAEVRGGQYHLQMLLRPDSVSYLWRVMMTGNGRADSWCNNGFGQSEIASLGLPTVAQYPPMINYVFPTLERGIVDSWVCSPHVITVANYNNEVSYLACNNTTQTLPGITENAIANCSSYGNTRTGLIKPDVAAPGDVTFSAAPLTVLANLQGGSGIFKLHWDCMHVRNGGTSIASPAVAGAVALYLQKCPHATHTEIIQALISTAYGDALTGALPNLRFGNGRLDAFALLNTTNFSVDVNGGGVLCVGDSLLVEGPPAYQSYVWTDGTTDQNAWSQGEELALTVTNGSGCASYSSDTVSFTFFPAPVAPVITANGLDLSCTLAETYQWFLNGELITGATAQQWTAETNGDYTAQTTDANGCAALSNTLNMFSVGGAEHVSASGLSVWPIPAHGLLNVHVVADGNFLFAVIDAAGRLVKQGNVRGAGSHALDISELTPGNYTLRLSQNDEEMRHGFVVR